MDGRGETGRTPALVDDPDFLRELVQRTLHAMLEEQMSAHLGAAKHERSERRTG